MSNIQGVTCTRHVVGGLQCSRQARSDYTGPGVPGCLDPHLDFQQVCGQGGSGIRGILPQQGLQSKPGPARATTVLFWSSVRTLRSKVAGAGQRNHLGRCAGVCAPRVPAMLNPRFLLILW